MVTVTLKEAKTSYTSNKTSVESIKHEIFEKFKIPEALFYLLANGRIVNDENLNKHSEIQLAFRTFGGKGGFGSMLRAIGAQIEKTTNREACRDLSGRRLRDINEEKRLKTWIEKKMNEEKEDPDEKFQKKIGKLLAVPKKEFKDADYDEARSSLLENISDSVEQGFKKARESETILSSVGLKRKSDEIDVKKKPVKKIKGAFWIDEGISSCSDTDDESDYEQGESSGAGSTSSKS
ncbi:CLUMA_CG008232, isoform A [Clunio marinus]|uniref:CLUMA_CG008232, isoform A n=1 Tax=Clunio marinus TaxID=568069 RepID=A0A1J1I570_9DIPT|nr:CLUMA_CG008232, isoform A [Clunio marinus]